jgi:hypothetical protein
MIRWVLMFLPSAMTPITVRSLLCLTGLVVLCAKTLPGQKGETPPVVTRQIQPEYGTDLSKSYVVDPVRVEMIVDAGGLPFSLSCTAGLPDNVVQALAQWRYRPGKKDGRESAFSTMLTVPVRRAIDRRDERSLRRIWRPAKELAGALKTGEDLDATKVARVRERLEADPNSMEARAILLAWESNPSAANSEEIHKLRAEQSPGWCGTRRKPTF